METLRFNRLVLLACFILVGIKLANSEEELTDKYDIFGASRIRGRNLVDEYTKINHMLCDETDSRDAQENFDIVLDYLVIDLKNNLPIESDSVRAKRLFLALSTISRKNQCSAYSHKLLSENEYAVDEKLNQPGIVLTRVERIIFSYINEHAYNCFHTYIDRYKKLSANLDEHSVKQVGLLLDRLIETYETKFQDYLKQESTKTSTERLYNTIIDRISTWSPSFKNYIQSSLRLLAQNDPDAKYVEALDNERFGIKKVNREKFTSLYDKFILAPCKYYINKLGPSIFELAPFDFRFYSEPQVEEEDFYTAWARYKHCHLLSRNWADHASIDSLIKWIEANENGLLKRER